MKHLVVVGGAGHIGLPLSLAFSKQYGDSLKVTILDSNRDSLEKLSRGELPFVENSIISTGILHEILDTYYQRSFFMTSSDDCLKSADFVIVALGTSIDEYLNPRYFDLDGFFDRFFKIGNPNALIILRSTVFPGTTERLSNKYGFNIAFCPERLAEGEGIFELGTFPQILGVRSKQQEVELIDLFKPLSRSIRSEDSFVVMSTREAELAKLMTNAYRYINFAIGNEFYRIAVEGGVSKPNEFLRKIKFNYPRLKSLYDPGWVGGSCLRKDTMQLSAFINGFDLGFDALRINEELPRFIISAFESFFSKASSIGLVGMSFKEGVDDIRDSLSYKIYKLLKLRNPETVCWDPLVSKELIPNYVELDDLIYKSTHIVVGSPCKELWARLHQLDCNIECSSSDITKRISIFDIWGSGSPVTLTIKVV